MKLALPRSALFSFRSRTVSACRRVFSDSRNFVWFDLKNSRRFTQINTLWRVAGRQHAAVLVIRSAGRIRWNYAAVNKIPASATDRRAAS